MRALVIILLVLGAFWALTLWLANRNEARAEASHPARGELLQVDGHQVHAEVMGEGPDVVLIHGSNGNTNDMTYRLAPALAKNYRVIVFDRPGLGYSDPLNPNGATITEQATQLMKAAQQLGADKPIVVGQSYGGAVALAWAVAHPDALAALVPIAGASNPWDTELELFYKLTANPIGAAVVNPLITAYVPQSVVEDTFVDVFAPNPMPEDYADHFGPGLSLRRDSLRANARQRYNLLGEIEELAPRYHEISVPTEIVHGTDDTVVGLEIHSQTLVEQIPDAVLTSLEGVGHMPQHVSVPEVVDAIDRAAERAGLR
ncbi:alpha/beta hydrolase [Ruegeria sp. 2012CJ41-6]|uniref:Alpha/beta hydrolase n=1 Tax=Ruegeria spongiae TaxID=2942209 RepID=A0ABT0PWI0_9RHOB|nr:alpha/beta hydrolase [Ruegeria spongiae]MCL6281964.1 alpha/beta hydrolase [Ruegeria spongiae]